MGDREVAGEDSAVDAGAEENEVRGGTTGGRAGENNFRKTSAVARRGGAGAVAHPRLKDQRELLRLGKF